MFFFFFSSRRRHTRWTGDWSSDVCSSDLAQRERAGLVVPAEAVTWPEPGHVPPRVLGEPEEDPGRVRARQRGRDGELDPGLRADVLHQLLDHRHPLAAHPDGGQDRVVPVAGWRPLGDADLRLLAAADVPVPGAWTEPAEQVAEHGL